MNFKGSKLVVVLLLLSACPKNLPGRYEVPGGRPLDSKTVSARTQIIADTQFHFLYGTAVWMRLPLIDGTLSPVAIRPPQLDIYSRYTLSWVLAQQQKDVPVIFLGDALDFSCKQEMVTFLEVMKAEHGGARRLWAFAPGNHDGYFYGNLHADDAIWKSACDQDGVGGPANKADVVAAYLGAVGDQDDDGAREFGAAIKANPKEGTWKYAGNKNPFFRAAKWKVDAANPWHSYVVQQVWLGRGVAGASSAVLIDTATYKREPALVPSLLHRNPAMTGSMGDDQIDAAREMVKAIHGAAEHAVVMGHHPAAYFDCDSRDFLDDAREDYDAVTYVSAHTHNGEWKVNGDEDDRWLELNIGSTTDWPQEYRSFELLKDSRGRVAISAPLTRVDARLTETGVFCGDERSPKPEDVDFYRSYADFGIIPNVAATALLDVALHTFKRQLKLFPSAETNTAWPCITASRCFSGDSAVLDAIETAAAAETGFDAKRALLLALQDVEPKRVAKDPAGLATYRLCESRFASQHEKLKVRTPLVTDDYILIKEK